MRRTTSSGGGGERVGMMQRMASANDLAQLNSDAWAKNKSYTDLAALATGYEAERPRSRTGSDVGGSSDERALTLYAQAMELINAGLKLDVSSPMQAVEYYQRGSDLVSEALELERNDESADRYQRTLDMCEERIRFITRTNNRLQTDSQLRLQLSQPGGLDVLDDDLPPTGEPPSPAAVAARPHARRATKNYFAVEQPETLPPLLREAAASFGDTFAVLARRFGFQHESVRCQQEHLMLLLANTASHAPGPAGGARALSVVHAKLLSSYRQWAEALRVQPACARPADVPNSKMTDIVLYLLLWGEASNLRHMPECLCFLFHAMRLELRAAAATGARPLARAPGWFLSRVVAPLYRAVRKCMHTKKSSGDFESHTSRANYDDANEFFWSAECLKHCYHDGGQEDDEMGGADLGNFRAEGGRPAPPGAEAGAGPVGAALVARRPSADRAGADGGAAGSAPAATSAALADAKARAGGGAGGGGGAAAAALAGGGYAGGARGRPPIGDAKFAKTYIERRSWLHPIKSFWRVHAFFQLIIHAMVAAALAAGSHGMLLDGWLCQALLHVWPAHAAYALLGELFEVYILWGVFRERRAEVAACAVRVGVKGAIAALLCVGYRGLEWEGEHLAPGASAGAWAAAVWQAHPALGAGCAAYTLPILCSLAMPLLPGLSTWLRTRHAGPVRLLMELWYPEQRLFVGKDMHEGCAPTLRYAFFWIVLIYFKLWFSYTLQIGPLVAPTLDLWRRRAALGEDVALALVAVKWTPMLITYHLDVQIWYVLLSALYGTVVGWQLKIGEVRDIAGIRRRFISACEAFNQGMLSEPTRQRLAHAAAGGESGGGGGAEPAADAAGADGGLLYSTMKGVSSAVGSVARGAPAAQAVELKQALLAEQGPNGAYATEAGAAGGGGGGASAAGVAGAARSERMVYFAEAWDEIIRALRMGDLICNRERDCLAFRHWRTTGTGGRFSRACYLPVLCTAGRVNAATDLLVSLRADLGGRGGGTAGAYSERRRIECERRLSAALARDVHMAEAVSEAWELGVWALGHTLGARHVPSMLRLEGLIADATKGWRRIDLLVPQRLPAMYKALCELCAALLAHQPAAAPPPAAGGGAGGGGGAAAPAKPAAAGSAAASMAAPAGGGASGSSSGALPAPPAHGADVGKVVDKVRALIDALKRCLSRTAEHIAAELDHLKFTKDGFFWDEPYALAQLDGFKDEHGGNEKRLRGLVLLLTTAELDAQPRGKEATRRLTWFTNSLFMAKPDAPPVARMPSWTIMTPYYSEDLIYSEKELKQTNEDAVSVLFFLQKAHPSEWHNFLERVRCRDEAEVRKKGLGLELRLWASFRGQTLVRTVDGEMLCERALRLQAAWDGTPPAEVEDLVRQKFSVVVSCQIYGQMRRQKSDKATDTEFLMRRYPNLRVAYVDKTSTMSTVVGGDGLASLTETIRWYSVLVRCEPKTGAVVEIYRVQLPGDPILGEGKPENQNHAMIFARGEAVQTLDMNQAGYFEECLKMRNLLMEFGANSDEVRPCTIVGFREHIFTAGLTSLATFMGLQEGCFVTLSQRVLYSPLRMRLHYGHPDLFDKLFSMTRGGVSKASKGINLSEDIFAGFSHTLRGGRIAYAEYAQVGKGRDVGMHQIYKFEAKLSQGNGEQMISRDVGRLGARLDFFRLLSFYYSGPGFYLNVALTVVCIYVFLYLQLWTCLYPVESEKLPYADILSLEWVLQLGLLLIIPTACFLAVEHGVLFACYEIVRTVACGSPLFFMFHMGTKAHYVSNTLKFGGARYRPTGRGFVMRHENFAEIYRFFAGSHFYPGFELLAVLVLWLVLGGWHGHGAHAVGHYWRSVWSSWAIVISWLFAPFWFNPVALDWRKLEDDLSEWWRWMLREGSAPDKSWTAWHHEEASHIYSTRSSLKMVHVLTPGVRYLVTFCGLINVAARANSSASPLDAPYLEALARVMVVLATLVLPVLLAGGGEMLVERSDLDAPICRRLYSLLSAAVCVCIVVVPLVKGWTDVGEIALSVIAGCYLLASCCQIAFAAGLQLQVVARLCQAYDLLCGLLLLALLFALSLPGIFDQLQVRTLFNAAFNRGLRYADLLVSIPQKGD